MKLSRLDLLLAIALIVALPLQRAHAYIDPGSGSYIIQVMIAAVLGGLYSLKLFWRRLIDRITGLFKKKPDEEKKDE